MYPADGVGLRNRGARLDNVLDGLADRQWPACLHELLQIASLQGFHNQVRGAILLRSEVHDPADALAAHGNRSLPAPARSRTTNGHAARAVKDACHPHT